MNNRPSGLGRGLGALIPSDIVITEDEATFQTVPVSAIHPNQYQPRDHFDEQALESLTNSVRELGVLQPLLVRPDGDRYELIAGERRWRAAKRAGLVEVPVIVRQAGDTDSLEQALVENLHREDLNAIEEAAAYQQLVEDFSFTQDKIAKRVGKSRSAIANTLRLLTLATGVQRLVSEGLLSAGHARALVVVDDEAEQVRLADQVVEEGWTVREVERFIKGESTGREGLGRSGSSRSGEPGAARPAPILELERLFSERLATTVGVSTGAKKGKIVIEYADLDTWSASIG